MKRRFSARSAPWGIGRGGGREATDALKERYATKRRGRTIGAKNITIDLMLRPAVMVREARTRVRVRVRIRTVQLSTHVDQDGISIPAMVAAIRNSPLFHGMQRKRWGY